MGPNLGNRREALIKRHFDLNKLVKKRDWAELRIF